MLTMMNKLHLILCAGFLPLLFSFSPGSGGAQDRDAASHAAQKEMISTNNSTKMLKEVSIEDFNASPFTFFDGNGSGLILCAGDSSCSNAMTIGWGDFGTLCNQPVLSVYVAQKRYTHEFMEKQRYFTVMYFANDEMPRYMGSHSGRDGDKAKALGLTTVFTTNGTPYYAEADLVIECRMMYRDTFSPENFIDEVPRKFYDGFAAGVHSVYVGRVLRIMKK